ncbi:PP2C family protein-serine/threonine phosphatase [Kitasatospora sp. NPDC006697]|uniref:PP2C family protein-serine/threonine phosphatase n=1 Tax=Kitasatospora sp. NPDC006697 TaxID=3364020 RepID=UPI0036C871E2
MTPTPSREGLPGPADDPDTDGPDTDSEQQEDTADAGDAGDDLRRIVARLRRANREYRRQDPRSEPGAPPSLPAVTVRLAAPEGQLDLGELLDALPMPASLVDPLLDPDGAVLDVAAIALNPAGARYSRYRSALRRDRYRTGDQPAEASPEPDDTRPSASATPSPSPSPDRGRPPARLTEAFPGLATPEVLTALTKTLRTGRPTPAMPVRWQVPRAAGRLERHRDLLTAHRCGGRLLLLWGSGDLAEMAQAAQRIARVGWGEWSLLDGALQSSSGLRDLLGRPAGAPGPTVADLLAQLDPSAVPPLQRALRGLLERGEAVDQELLFRVGGGLRRIRLVAEALREEDGPVFGLRGVLQNVTELAESRSRLRRQQEEIERQARRADAEEAVVRRLQDALQPRAVGALDAVGLRTAVAYRPTEGRVGGDWYKLRVLPQGPALIAVGDARGHGLDAVALMSTLRHALAGMAYSGAQVEELTGWLNNIACDEGPESTATAVVARFFPPSRLLRWVCAGHLPPVLLGDGPPRLLTPRAELGELGLPLGVLRDTRYEAVEMVLHPGQTVLLYTDGLVERRDRDIDDRLDTLLAVLAEQPPTAEPQALVDGVVRAMSGPLDEDDATLLALRLHDAAADTNCR